MAAELGAEFESVDAASPNFTPAKLEAAVAACDCVWVTGGNTFYLWHHMRASGLDQMVKDRLTQPGAFYFGQSAGSIVAGRSVSTAFWKGWDDPSAAPETDWDNPENLAGMALAGSDPVMMLTAPIPATEKLLARAGMKIDQVDRYEVNEAFASVPLAWLHDTGADPEKLNANGGATALGHPLGCTGTKLATTLLHELERSGGRYGLETMCEGGGLANATLFERL